MSGLRVFCGGGLASFEPTKITTNSLTFLLLVRCARGLKRVWPPAETKAVHVSLRRGD